MNRTRDFYDLILQHGERTKRSLGSASTGISRLNVLEMDRGSWHACPLSAGPIPSGMPGTMNE